MWEREVVPSSIRTSKAVGYRRGGTVLGCNRMQGGRRGSRADAL